MTDLQRHLSSTKWYGPILAYVSAFGAVYGADEIAAFLPTQWPQGQIWLLKVLVSAGVAGAILAIWESVRRVTALRTGHLITPAFDRLQRELSAHDLLLLDILKDDGTLPSIIANTFQKRMEEKKETSNVDFARRLVGLTFLGLVEPKGSSEVQLSKAGKRYLAELQLSGA